MVDKNAGVGFGALPKREGRTDHLHDAHTSQDSLEALASGTPSDGAGMPAILRIATTEIVMSEADSERSETSVLSKNRLETVGLGELDWTACGVFRSEHEESLEPKLWENLGRDLLPLIFARLPLAAIGRLRSVSKEWRKSVDSFDSTFSRELRAVNLRAFAVISPLRHDRGDFVVRAFDAQSHIWHCYKIRPTFFPSMSPCQISLRAADGGLVCFVSVDPSGPYSISVMNPITLNSKTLPCPHRLREREPLVVHLSVDSLTGKYKVMVAGYKRRHDEEDDDEDARLVKEVYDSGTGQWTDEDSSEVFEFVRLGCRGGLWVTMEDHSCCPLELYPTEEFKVWLQVACGYLIVFAVIECAWPLYHESGWLYDLSTRKCSDLPVLPEGFGIRSTCHNELCELNWSAIP